ncbi:MAG: 23S rRNA pseudouridine(1911/1915/1917) synthase [Candidatus Westeberhardia cardiocondylae]|nr:23S rRNA pseudouridine(1911/1915/1917) synthase [Candidatus Westeberhardia cardiocondylae]
MFIKIINSLHNKIRIDKALSILLPKYSRSKIKSYILQSYITSNNKIINSPKKYIYGGENIQIKVPEENKNLNPKNIKLNIIYNDNEIVAINKPNNMSVYPGNGKEEETLLHALLYHYPKIYQIPRAGIIHRLDKNTTGIMIIAKTAFMQNKLTQLIKNKQIIKEYEAIVTGNIIQHGSIHAPIKRHQIRRTQMTVHATGKQSTTHYNIIRSFPHHTYIKIYLETGRTHQIRVHMQHINHPIVGDKIYGKSSCQIIQKIYKQYKKKLLFFNRQALHAKKITFNHPITHNTITLRAPLPHDILSLLKILDLSNKKKT